MSADLASADEGTLSAIALRAMKQFAAESAGDKTASTVSVSLDFTGEAFTGGAVDIDCDIDRQTRTLIFLHAYLRSGDRTLIKATSIFRLS